ncbi:MAG TPA: NAD(P)H-binding protein [Pelobium sp.]|nr:NAD(P)H-binding protein [Pelobium sp.]
MDKILVTGGSGLLGREIVNQLISEKQNVAILTTQTHPDVTAGVEVFTGDLITGKGLSNAVINTKAIIHCASNPLNFEETDVLGTQNLVKAIDKHQPPHLIYVSIVGVDRSNYPYYVAKKQVEDLISGSGIPFTVLRTTQFHQFVHRLINGFLNTKEKLIQIPDGMTFQPVALDEVAKRLVSLSKNKAEGLLPNFGGPEILTFEEMFEQYLQVFKSEIDWKTVPLVAPRYELFRSSVNLCEGNAFGKTTWKEFLGSLCFP